MEQKPVIEVRNVSVYQGNNLVLAQVNMNVMPGEFVYLIGKTGSGKSSLLKMFYAEVPLTSGDIEVAGFKLKNIREKDIPFLRRKEGIIFQDFQLLYDRNVNDNLMFVMRSTGWQDKSEMEKQCSSVLAKVGLSNKGQKMPHELSGGEQQRVAIARALVNQPVLVLADEPTGNLDPETSGEIVKLLIDISKTGCAIVMATHDFLMVNKFPARTIKCEDGKITDSSPVSV